MHYFLFMLMLHFIFYKFVLIINHTHMFYNKLSQKESSVYTILDKLAYRSVE